MVSILQNDFINSILPFELNSSWQVVRKLIRKGSCGIAKKTKSKRQLQLADLKFGVCQEKVSLLQLRYDRGGESAKPMTDEDEPQFFCDSCSDPIVGAVRFDCLVCFLLASARARMYVRAWVCVCAYVSCNKSRLFHRKLCSVCDCTVACLLGMQRGVLPLPNMLRWRCSTYSSAVHDTVEDPLNSEQDHLQTSPQWRSHCRFTLHLVL